jgi:hypothetical protein
MSDNNQPDKQIEKEKENKDCEVSEESEESEENESEEEVVEREVIDFNRPLRTKEDYFLRPRKPGLKPSRKIYGEDSRYSDTMSTELSDSDANSKFELGNEIETFNFKKLEKVKPYKGRKRTYEESEWEDSYTDSLEEGDSEYKLKNVISDVDGDNENTITQKEKDWLEEWNKYYIWDEEKKEHNSKGKRVKNDFLSFSQEQIQRAEARKRNIFLLC